MPHFAEPPSATPQPDPNDTQHEACCSAMRMIQLLALNAPPDILAAELRNLVRLSLNGHPLDLPQ